MRLPLQGRLQHDAGQLAAEPYGGQFANGQNLAVGGLVGDGLQVAPIANACSTKIDSNSVRTVTVRSIAPPPGVSGLHPVIPEMRTNLQNRVLHPRLAVPGDFGLDYR